MQHLIVSMQLLNHVKGNILQFKTVCHRLCGVMVKRRDNSFYGRAREVLPCTCTDAATTKRRFDGVVRLVPKEINVILYEI